MNSYDEYIAQREAENSASNKIFNSIKPVHIILLIALVIIGNKILENSSNNRTVIIISIALLAIYIFSAMRQRQKKAIPRRLAEQIAWHDLNSEVGLRGSFAHGTTINPTGYFKDQSVDTGEGMQLFKYNIGFEIKEPNKGPREIVYQMNPFTGESKGIIEKPTGFTGEDIKDIQLIFPETVMKETKNE